MPSKPCNVVVLLSGSGSNLQALIDSCHVQDSPVRIGAVVSNRADAYGLQRAQAAGIAALGQREFLDRARAIIREEKPRLKAGLEELGCRRQLPDHPRQGPNDD